MPWRLLFFIICMVIFAVFAAANGKPVDEINLIFHTFKNVPLFAGLIVSFALGVIITLPFALFGRAKKARKGDSAKLTRAEKKAAKLAQKKPADGEGGAENTPPAP
ncbi:MAG: hypothetical protein LBR23_09120 [Spirochaetaceae bacterium]|jgi:uncharacterized integral membrane protein|nr:hypothetical protein [Spirochaetaceae bacterium]